MIDEGDNIENGDDTDGRSDRSKNTVPHCQGCNERDAEFVCAGCQRQWYCSRECQVSKIHCTVLYSINYRFNKLEITFCLHFLDSFPTFQIAAWDEHSEQCFPASNDN